MLGVDRLDYTKGIKERMLAVERFLTRRLGQLAVGGPRSEKAKDVHPVGLRAVAQRRRQGEPLDLVAEHVLKPGQKRDQLGTARTLEVGVQLVDDHEAQGLEELRPLGVVRQDALVQHVGVGDHDIAAGAHRLACIAGRVAVESEGAHAQFTGFVERHQLRHLVLRQGFGGEHIQRLGFGLQRRLQHRQVVAQRFARGGRCHDDRVFAAPHGFPGPRLVRVEPLHATRLQCPRQACIQVGRQRCVAAGPGGDDQLAGNACPVFAAQVLRQCLGRVVRGGAQVLGRCAHTRFSIGSLLQA